MINPLPALLAELRRGRTGLLAAIALVALAVSLGVAVSAAERALRKGSAAAAAPFDLVIGAPGSATQLVLTTVYLQPAALPLVDGGALAKLAADPGVADAAPIAFGDFYRGHPVVGTSAGLVTQGGRLAPAEGRLFARADEVVIGAAVRLALGDGFHPVHGAGHGVEDEDEPPEHGEITYRVVGRMPPLGSPWDHAILAPVEAVWLLHGLPTGHRDDHVGTGPDGAIDLAGVRIGPPWDGERLAPVPAIVVRPRSVGDAYRLRGAWRRGGTMAVFPAEVLVDLYATLGDARDLLAAIALATEALVVGAVLLAALATLQSRRRQLAVLRALGASRLYVFATVWLQVATLIAVGAGLGLGLGWLIAAGLARHFTAGTGVALRIAIAMPELRLVGALAAIGLLLAAIPAAAAYRQPVASGLKG